MDTDKSTFPPHRRNPCPQDPPLDTKAEIKIKAIKLHQSCATNLIVVRFLFVIARHSLRSPSCCWFVQGAQAGDDRPGRMNSIANICNIFAFSK